MFQPTSSNPKKISITKKIALVTSSYHADITSALRDGAREALTDAGIPSENIIEVGAPGAFEIPFICQKLATTGEYAGIIALGCVIRGDTDHYVYIAGESTRGIMDVMLTHHIPITNAILTVETLLQAQSRSHGDMNKGGEAAHALIDILR